MVRDAQAPWADTTPARNAPLTIEGLARLPDDGRGYELVEGRLVRMPPAGGWHGQIAMNLGAALSIFAKTHHAGVVLAAETGFHISASGEPDTVLAPDVAFVRAENVPKKDDPQFRGYWRIAPDLAVEVASPSQTLPEMSEKAARWLRAGTQIVWVIWPDARRVDVWSGNASEASTAMLAMGDTLTAEAILPGFSYPVASLFT